MGAFRWLVTGLVIFSSVGCNDSAGQARFSPDGCAPGQEGCSCEGERCDTGLLCEIGICVASDGTGGAGGTDGEPEPTPIDHCADEPCVNGSCQNGEDGYVCSCDAGWTGDDCEQEVKNGCDDSPCENGSCTNLMGGDYSCACEPGWSGPNCDHNIDDCDSEPCENGSCSDGVDSYTCTCDAGWEGPTCGTNIDDCTSAPCAHGSCTDAVGSYSCACETGWTGDDCDEPVSGCADSPCLHGTCTDTGPNTYSCECEAGWDDENCDACAEDYVLEQGACINQKQAECTNDAPLNAVATIADVTITYTTAGGWTAPADCPFTCNAGWEGVDCGQSVDDCSDNACDNDSICVDEHQGYSCSCLAGFGGDFCELDIDDCTTEPCVHGECTDGADSYSCECNPGWDGDHCDICATDFVLEQGACIKEKQVACTDNAPVNGTSTPGSVTVTYTTEGGWSAPTDCAFTCNAGWHGSDCSQSIDDCPGNACENGSSCVDGHQGYTCDCPAGYEGSFCEIDIDECVSSPCVHGTCTDGVNAYSCACDTGWAGDDCDECALDYILEQGTCMHEKQVACVDNAPVNGTSTPGSVTVTYTTASGWAAPADCAFTCNAGWQGSDCSQSIDDCPDNACNNGSTCVDAHLGYSCTCLAGYEGSFCEIDIDECAPSPCVQGTCTDGIDAYSCDCDTGWAGVDCDTCALDYAFVAGECIDEMLVPCTDNTPENSTATVAAVTVTYTTNSGWTTPADCSYTCDDGWEGDDCDTPVCNCPGTEVCDSEGACYEPFLIDDFRTCDLSIYEAEGRRGSWHFYRHASVGCSGSTCQGVSTPSWGGGCGAWSAGSSAGSGAYAGMGFGLNADGPLYDACGYNSLEITYRSDRPVRLYAKWGDVGTAGLRASVTLPATTGASTATVDLLSFANLDCSLLTEFQLEPTSIPYGMAVYDVRFSNALPACTTNGAVRCSLAGDIQTCVNGAWTASSCPAGESCSGDQCVEEVPTPVERHGHLSVSDAQLVDQFGQPVQLKGVSSHWLNWADDGYQLNRNALEWMRDNWGLSVFRAAMGTEQQNGYLAGNQAAMLSQVETIIINAVSAGVYVIVDWHTHYAEDQTSQAVAFFQDIADRYGYLPNVIFEVYNEPLDLDWNTELRPYHQTLVNALRTADSDANENVVILGTPNWDQDVDVVSNPSARVVGSNLMYTLHFYACSHTDSLRARAQSAHSAGVPLFVTEWGATAADGGISGTPVCTASADAWQNWMDANDISWAAWKLDDCDHEIQTNGVADTSCLLKQGAPLNGGWTSNWLNGHAPYVVSKMQN